ncbi:MAG: DUF362 domain-containing protein [Candidatus Aureabacteria bacterium]|nr:DUF362 domain-containing protein [Candidatus Auribacterota bacterium]
MDRRHFLKSLIGYLLFYGSMFSFKSLRNLHSQEEDSSVNPYDVVAVKGGEPDQMFDAAIKILGGMKTFVKKNQTVVIKPNMGWDVSPEKAGNTNPLLVAQVIKHCFQAGAKEVSVFDNTCDHWQSTYRNSGIEKAAKEAGAHVVPANDKKYYRPVEIPGAKILKDALVHELILDSDVFINMPVLKHHGSARLTIAMKNLMGIVWDRHFWHRNDLHQCIADFCLFKKPDLNVIDAYRVLMRNGPRGGSESDVSTLKTLILSRDMVAGDAAAAKIFGAEPQDIPYIQIANEMGVGVMNLDNLNISRIKM